MSHVVYLLKEKLLKIDDRYASMLLHMRYCVSKNIIGDGKWGNIQIRFSSFSNLVSTLLSNIRCLAHILIQVRDLSRKMSKAFYFANKTAFIRLHRQIRAITHIDREYILLFTILVTSLTVIFVS